MLHFLVISVDYVFFTFGMLWWVWALCRELQSILLLRVAVSNHRINAKTRSWGKKRVWDISCSKVTSENGLKLCQGYFNCILGKINSAKRVVMHWNWLPREVVKWPSLEVFKRLVDVVLRDMVDLAGPGQEMDSMNLEIFSSLRILYFYYFFPLNSTVGFFLAISSIFLQLRIIALIWYYYYLQLFYCCLNLTNSNCIDEEKYNSWYIIVSQLCKYN